MGNKKYDPFIFGTVNINIPPKKCDGYMLLVERDTGFNLMLRCSTCGAIRHMSAIEYLDTKYSRGVDCGAICPE